MVMAQSKVEEKQAPIRDPFNFVEEGKKLSLEGAFQSKIQTAISRTESIVKGQYGSNPREVYFGSMIFEREEKPKWTGPTVLIQITPENCH